MRVPYGRLVRLLALPLVATILAACAGMGSGASGTPTPKVQVTPIPRATAVVQKGTISETISMLGRVTSVQQADLAFKTPGQVATVTVQVNQKVKAGQVLAELDTTDLQSSIQQAQNNVELAQIRVDQALVGTSPTPTPTPSPFDLRTAELAVRQAEASLATAQDNLVKARNSPSAVDTAQQAVNDAQAALATAESNRDITMNSDTVVKNVRDRQNEVNWYEVNYGTVLDAFNKGEAVCPQPNSCHTATQADVDQAWSNLLTAKSRLATAQVQAQQAIDQANNNVAKAQASLDTALANLEAAKKQDPNAAVNAAQLAVDNAQLALDKARATYEQKLNPPTPAPTATQGVDLNLKTLQNSLSQAQATLDSLLVKLNGSKLVAPFDATVTNVRIKVGDQVTANTVQIGLANPSNLQVQTDLTTTDLQRVALGQTVSFTVDALAGQTIKGTVVSIPGGLQGQTASSSSTTVQIQPLWPEGYETKVQLGVLARGTILVQEKKDVLIVPVQAIKVVGDRTFVEYMDGQIRRAQSVVVGIADSQYAEIVSGLQEGQTILVGS